MGSLEGKVALVTGGAQGIGYAVTAKLVSEGARVLFVDLDDAAAKKVHAEFGDAVVPFVGDLLDPAIPDNAVKAVIDSFGALDIIVNNAGFYWDSQLHKMTDAQWQTMLDIHVTAPFRILRASAPHLFAAAKKDAESGVEIMRKVVNVSSLAASFGLIGASNYAAAKAAVIGLTKSLAKEWGPRKICVNAVSFGGIQTRFALPQTSQTKLITGGQEVQMGVSPKVFEKRGITIDPDRKYTDEEIYKPRVSPDIPLGRIGHITEAADTIYYLCSPLSNYVTGQVLIASGGASGGMS